MPPYRARLRRRIAWLGLIVTCMALALIARPGRHLWRTAKNVIDHLGPLPPGYTDDASRMNLTAVREVHRVPADAAEAETELAKLLHEARVNRWSVAIAGARHSMGVHTMARDGVVIDMLPLDSMEFDAATSTLQVGAGALWSDVLSHLDARGQSVAVMQSNNSFSVGGSISVNCHGWQASRPPIAATVRSLRLMLHDGTVVRCSREENAELFSAVLGGYGLFGIILDVNLQVVPNQRYRLERRHVETVQLPNAWNDAIREHDTAEMIFGRLNVAADRFLDDALIYVFYVDPNDAGPIPSMHEPRLAQLKRHVFRGSAETDYGKRLRWKAELNWQQKLGGDFFSRNQLLNEGVEILQNRSEHTTDILHEYFVPRDRFAAFISSVQEIVPEHKGDLLNVTVRGIDMDNDTMLRYADQSVISLVMLFQQPRSITADEQMAAMTRDLIDAALNVGGRYYLPYRLHATRDQFRRAYPWAAEFFALKRKYDPQCLFKNEFYLKYGLAK